MVLTDTALLVLLGGGLLLVDPRAAVLSVAYLGLVALGVHKGLSKWSAVNGARLGAAGVSNVVAIQESVVLHRELLVLGRLGNQYERTRAGLETGARARATQSVIGQIPRIVYDAALVVGALLLAAWQLRTSTLAEALAVLLIFMAAASRIIPSLLRINGQLIQMRSAAAQSQLTFDLARRVAVPVAEGWQAPALSTTHPAASSEPRAASHLVVRGVSFTYPSGAGPVLHEVSLDAGPGTMLAIVGPTGGGKSTLADVVAGVIVPQSGSVTIDGAEPLARVAASPGSIGYVPQRVALVDGTVRDNVALALDRADVDDERVWAALREAQVGEVIEALDEGLDTRVGEHGLRLSGGQRQRLGIARALYSRPSLLILDEATSALDAETELAIARGLTTLRGTVTVVVIAHRLASVKTADQVVYLDHGRVAGAGTFESLSQSSEAFARQVEILSMPPRSATS